MIVYFISKYEAQLELGKLLWNAINGLKCVNVQISFINMPEWMRLMSRRGLACMFIVWYGLRFMYNIDNFEAYFN